MLLLLRSWLVKAPGNTPNQTLSKAKVRGRSPPNSQLSSPWIPCLATAAQHDPKVFGLQTGNVNEANSFGR